MFKFKDDNEENKMLAKSINDSTAKILRLSNDLQIKAGVMSYLIMVNDWYIQDNNYIIGEHFDDAETEHLRGIDEFFMGYSAQLTEFNEVMDNILEILKNHFDYDDEDIKNTIKRVVKDL